MRRALCYGDSNTFGVGPMAYLSSDPVHNRETRWAGIMAVELGHDWDVVVEGLPGRTTVHDDPIEGDYRNGLRMLRGIIESHRPLDLLILKLGSNDQKRRFGLGPQDVAMGVARLIKEAMATECVGRVLVICPAAIRECGDLAELFGGAEARMVGLPAEMERFATENGAAFLDAGKLIEVDWLDGVHYSAESHDILGRAVAAKVREMFA